jgi:flavin reductase (DIM6/NTAB) family NADH-FMN oxidoreductase RutF
LPKPEPKASPIDHALFREVMGSFATGVTVITTAPHGEVRGMTANAFMSGSLAPPLCAISVARAARMHGFLAEAGHFGVSILSHDQQRLSAHFSGRPDPDLKINFAYIGRTPVLADSAATIAAEIVATHACGDHSIIIGRIRELAARTMAPLVVHRGRYASLSYAAEAATGPTIEFW